MNHRALSNHPRTILWGVVAAANLAILGLSTVVLLVTVGLLVGTFTATSYVRRGRTGPRLNRARSGRDGLLTGRDALARRGVG